MYLTFAILLNDFCLANDQGDDDDVNDEAFRFRFSTSKHNRLPLDGDTFALLRDLTEVRCLLVFGTVAFLFDVV